MADTKILSIRVDVKDKDKFVQLCRTRKQNAGVVFNDLIKLMGDQDAKKNA